MQGGFEFLLSLLSCSCCVTLPALVLGGPFIFLAVRGIAARPERRGWITVAVASGNAVLSGLVLGPAGFVLGFSAQSEDAATAVVFLGIAGVIVGMLVGFVVTVAAVAWGSRPAAPTPPPELRRASALRFGAWTLGVSIVLLFLGVATSLAGLAFSVSVGMFSLAAAQMIVRPIALFFVGLHLLTGIASVLALRRDARPEHAWGALAASGLGVVLATIIAIFGPDFFEGLLAGAARGLLV